MHTKIKNMKKIMAKNIIKHLIFLKINKPLLIIVDIKYG